LFQRQTHFQANWRSLDFACILCSSWILMHELELGVLKAVFIHFLDRRFREIPPFGRDGVRKTRSNRSVSQKMTAHDYGATLQCAIPVFDNLLPEPHNMHALKLLFDLAHWHALAKLRMHADTTLELLTPLLATTSENSRTRRVPCFSLPP
jgi:hypothetical protein